MFSLPEHKNLKQVIVESTNMDELFGNVFELSNFELAKNFVLNFPRMCTKDLAEPKVQQVLQEKYDMAILSMFFTDCFLSFIHKQKVIFILNVFNIILFNAQFPKSLCEEQTEGRISVPIIKQENSNQSQSSSIH